MSQEIILSPNNIPVLSKTNVASFHEQVKSRIFETGFGLFEYLEMIKFCAALDKQINGDNQAKIEPDKEFINYIRDQIPYQSGNEKTPFTTNRGVKFSLAETGTSYDFSQCNDPVLTSMEEEAKRAAEEVKQRKEFLKTVPASGLLVTDQNTGETFTVYPPSKSSKSSFKVQLPK